ncbi:MAG: cyclase family protein [Bauldia sp.]|nr:cyclase family protein [Bauldia sp.]
MSNGLVSLPRYADLPGGSATGLFGSDDWLGRLNLLTPDRTRSAARLVTEGKVFSLNAPVLTWNIPHVLGDPNRTQPKHTVLQFGDHNDDIIDNWNPQSSTQWDHFLHFPNPTTDKYYNGHHLGCTGVEVWAERGIVGRGVLLDVARWRISVGRPLDPLKRDLITVADLADCAAASGVALGEGTIVIIRTGWETFYRGLTGGGRARLPHGDIAFPGLEASEEMAAWLWDSGVAAVAADNATLEAWPMLLTEYVLHEPLLTRLGIPIGELWLVDSLAEACRAANRYEFFLTSAPMNLAGGVSSPANALAIL